MITEFTSDGVEEVQDVDGLTNAVLMEYIHGPGVDEIAFYADRVNGGSFYPITDHLGSVVALQQRNVSTMAEAFHYTAYGEIAAGEESGYPFRFTGRRYDAETGLYYYRARYYNPILGRFYQTDPIGYGDNMNMYAYVGNDPVNGKDPSGLCGPCFLIVPVVEAIGTGAAAVSTSGLGTGLALALGLLTLSSDSTSDGDGATAGEAGPEDIVGSDPRPSNKPGGRTNSGPLAPENGGTDEPEEDFNTLTGGKSGPVPDDSTLPEGSRVGENGVIIRPGTDGNGPRIDIPAQGDKPRETLHYPRPEGE